jgi:hypothetical protein
LGLAEAKTKIELSASEPLLSGFRLPARSGLEIPPSADAFMKAVAKVALGVRIALFRGRPKPPRGLRWVPTEGYAITVSQRQVVLRLGVPTLCGGGVPEDR